MALRNRVILIVVAAMAAAGALLFAVLQIAAVRSATEVERSTALKNLDRAEGAMGVSEGDLARTAVDRGRWDATYAFMKGTNPAYRRRELDEFYVADLLVNYLGLYRPDGTLLHGTGVKIESEEPTEVPGANELLARFPVLNRASRPNEGVSGVLKLPDGRFMLVAAHAVLHTDNRGPALGTLVVGKFIDKELVESWSNLADVELRLAALPPGASGHGTLSKPVVSTSGDKVLATRTLADVSGTPVLRFQIADPRTVYRIVADSLAKSAWAIAGLVLTAMIVIGLATDRLVLRRVSSLTKQVDRIRSTNRSEHVSVPGSDELSLLGDDVNAMVTALDRSREELKVHLRRLGDSERRYRSLVDNMAEAVLALDRHGVVVFTNARIQSVLGWQPDEVTGKSIYDFLSPSSASSLRDVLEGGLTSNPHVLGLRGLMPDGDEIDVEFTLSPIAGSDGWAQGILRDVTMETRYENELLYMASHDYLTGLWNRRRFEEELEHAIARSLRHKDTGAVIWINLDRFKEVNDTLGHKEGDEVLMRVGQALAKVVREGSTLARLSGDEFAVLEQHANVEEAARVADRLLAELRELQVTTKGHPIRLSASIGIALFPEHGRNADELMAFADVAMSHAKDLGRSRWVVYSPSEPWHSEVGERRTWTERIQDALEHEGLVAYAQPIVRVEDRRIEMYELLVRMKDREGGLIAPDVFLTAAERTGIVRDVDMWMLKQAVGILSSTPGTVHINLNLSARTIIDSSFFEEMRAMMAGARIEPGRLGVEITETAVINDTGHVTDSVRLIKDMGCRFSVDDFGSGFSSFFYLKHLPADELKIDGTYVRRLTESPSDQHLVRAMVEMARGLEMKTTAEFVQSDEALEMLRGFGVDYAQGFFVGKPGPAEEVIARLSREEQGARASAPRRG